ncbi:hypothetical protein BDR05DRAFT_1003633 [Suillus weaverae]|nr:hypothetical protein BDR05DRAFT_1003633 [Suillus weaverae]
MSWLAVWLRTLHADGNFTEPTILTLDLAKFKYFCNATLLLGALLDKDKDTDSTHADDYNRVAEVHQCVLRLSPPTTFNFIYEMQQYASSLAFNQTKEPNIYIDPEVASITIGTQMIWMEKLQEGVQALLKDFKMQHGDLMNDHVMLTVIPDALKDDHTNSIRGYLFLFEEPFYEKQHLIFLFLVKSFSLAMVDNTGHISWNIPAIKTSSDGLCESGNFFIICCTSRPTYLLMALNSSITRVVMQTGIETSSSQANKCSSS